MKLLKTIKEKAIIFIFNIFKKQILEITLPISRIYQSVQIVETKLKPELLRYQYTVPFNLKENDLILDNAKQCLFGDIKKYINIEENESYYGDSKIITLSINVLTKESNKPK